MRTPVCPSRSPCLHCSCLSAAQSLDEAVSALAQGSETVPTFTDGAEERAGMLDSESEYEDVTSMTEPEDGNETEPE